MFTIVVLSAITVTSLILSSIAMLKASFRRAILSNFIFFAKFFFASILASYELIRFVIVVLTDLVNSPAVSTKTILM